MKQTNPCFLVCILATMIRKECKRDDLDSWESFSLDYGQSKVYFKVFATFHGRDHVKHFHTGSAKWIVVKKQLSPNEAREIYMDQRKEFDSMECESCDCEERLSRSAILEIAGLQFDVWRKPEVAPNDLELAHRLALEENETLIRRYGVEEQKVHQFRSKLQKLDSDSE
jgi:hypothetical protein